MEQQAHITINRGTSYADRLRAYDITIDGVSVASVRAGETASFDVAPGPRSIALRIDWCSSPNISFEAQPGQQITFRCGSSLSGWRVLLAIFYIMFRRESYLWLHRAHDA